MSEIKERRSYFRINELIGLTYSTLDDNAAIKPEGIDELGMPLTDLFAELDIKLNKTTNILWQENPTVAEALGLLNQKISIIAAHGLQTGNHAIESYEDIMVNISGCGIAFDTNEHISPGTRLKVSVVLKPSHIKLDLTAVVVACEEQPAGTSSPYWMRIHFEDNDIAAHEQLIQHVVQKQFAQINNDDTGKRKV